MSDICVVLRGNGERTERQALAALIQLSPIPIWASPFDEAVRECFRIGLSSGAKWLMVADADVLSDMRGVLALIDAAERLPRRVWHLQGRIQCKLYGGKRQGGHRLYRVSRLTEALPLVRDAVRVESDLIKRFPGRTKFCETVTGKHDYQQWYRDLHRKGASHSRKHPSWEPKARMWLRSRDMDLVAAGRGWYGLPLDMVEKEPLC